MDDTLTSERRRAGGRRPHLIARQMKHYALVFFVPGFGLPLNSLARPLFWQASARFSKVSKPDDVGIPYFIP